MVPLKLLDIFARSASTPSVAINDRVLSGELVIPLAMSLRGVVMNGVRRRPMPCA
jgi:hypothetical protein